MNQLIKIKAHIKNLLSNMGIKQLVVLISLLPAIIISILLNLYFNVIRTKELNQEIYSKGKAIASRLSSIGKYELLNESSESLHDIMREIIDNEVVSASFFNASGKLVATTNIKNNHALPTLLATKENINEQNIFFTIINETKNAISFASPISLSRTCSKDDTKNISSINLNSRIIIGWSQIEISKIPTKIKAYEALINSILIMIFGITISSLLAIRLGKKVTDPIFKLSNAVEKISNGELNTAINTNAKWELSILESGIRTMTFALKHARSRMQYSIKRATMKLKKQNIELEISRKKAEHANKVKSRFLTNISHELRTPLNSITGFVNLLQRTKLDKWQTEYLNTINKSSICLLNIINNILDFSKIEYGKLQLNIELMDIRECVDDALGQLSFLAHDKQLELITIISPDIPKQIRSDSIRIKQIITNLVTNCVKFTNTGDIIVHLVLLNETQDTVSICCSITDTIMDVSTIQKNNLLNNFSNNYKKYNKIIKHHYDHGVGISFTVCNKIISQMKGIFHIKSKPTKGYSFSFIFTAQKVVNESCNPNIENFNLPPIKILLFDQNNTTLDSIFNTLSSWGANVTTLTEKNILLKEIKNNFNTKDPYQMLIIGSNNPITDPIITKDFFNKIKKIFLCQIGVLVNTTDHVVHSYIIKLGASICLAKPISHKKFYNALCKIFVPKIKDFIVSQNMCDLNVLVVDDNRLNLKLIVAFLQNIAVNVTTANSGTEALNIISNKPFNIIFMDILMPDINGIQVANIIRQTNNPNRNSIIITLSAHMLLAEQDLLKTAGINDYLTKPITENQLRAVIYKWTQYDNIKEQKHFDNESNIKNIPSLDWKLSLKLAAGKSKLAKDLFEMMITSLPKEKKLINSAFKEQNLQELREHVHKLHGGCCYTGFSRLKYISKKLEQEIIFKNHDKISEYITFINQEINFLISNYHQSQKTISLQPYHS